MKNKWQEYKEKMGTTRPWDLLNPGTEYVSDQISGQRYSLCLECPELIKATKQCKQCGCFMALKTKMLHSTCPLGKW